MTLQRLRQCFITWVSQVAVADLAISATLYIMLIPKVLVAVFFGLAPVGTFLPHPGGTLEFVNSNTLEKPLCSFEMSNFQLLFVMRNKEEV